MGNQIFSSSDDESEPSVPQRRSQIPAFAITLLGSAETGKSTIFKHLQRLVTPNLVTPENNAHYRPHIYYNVANHMNDICEYITRNKYKFEKSENAEIAKKLQQVIDMGANWTNEKWYTQELGQYLKQLWSDRTVQKVLSDAAVQFHIHDCYVQ